MNTQPTAIESPSPPNPWLPQLATIIDKTPETTGVTTYRLRLSDSVEASRFSCEPGQFNMLYVPGFGESAISGSGPPRVGGDLLHTVRTAGNVTRRLAELRPGDSLGVRGPFGTRWPIDLCEGQDVVIVAGGIGLAPLRPVIYALMNGRQRFGQCTLIYGARSPDMLLYEREYPSWREAGINVLTTVDRSGPNWLGAIGVVTMLIDRFQPLVAPQTTFMMCGPDVMMKYSLTSITRRGVTLDRIWLSLERNMQCAVGLCGHCQFGPTFVCKDGPVLRADRVEPLLHVSHL
jgi:NAD(P)H-flavin reductase